MKIILLTLAITSTAAWAQSSKFEVGKHYKLDRWECLDVYGNSHPYMLTPFNGSNFTVEPDHSTTWKQYGSVASVEVLESSNSQIRLQLNGKLMSGVMDPETQQLASVDYTSISTFSNLVPNNRFVSDNPGYWITRNHFTMDSNDGVAVEASGAIRFLVDGFVEKVGNEVRIFRQTPAIFSERDCGVAPTFIQIPMAPYPPFTEEGMKLWQSWHATRDIEVQKIDFRKASFGPKSIDNRSEAIPVYVISVFKEVN